MEERSLVVFQNKKIRRVWHNNEWYFSVVDVIAALTDSSDVKSYISKMRLRDEELSKGWGQFVHPLSISTSGGIQKINCANTKSLFRIIQSIPSPKAEPLKLWLAQVGYERIQEIENPQLAQERMKLFYEQKGYSKSWIDKRLRSITIRQDLTDEWKNRGVNEGKEFSILTAEISKATFGLTPNEYKNLKGLQKEELRDHMNDLELLFTMLGEASTTELEKVKDPKSLEEHKFVSKEGGDIAGNARRELEKKTKKPIISNENYLHIPEKEKRKQLK